MLKSSSILVALLLSAAASPALAAPQESRIRIVSYADLDLGRAAGRDRLEQRIGAAIRAVCGDAAPTDHRGSREVRLCRSETRAQVAADLRTGRVFVSQSEAGTE